MRDNLRPAVFRGEKLWAGIRSSSAWLRLLLVLAIATSPIGCGAPPGAEMIAETEESEPVGFEPTRVQEEPEPTLLPATPPPPASPTPIIVEAELSATETDALGQIDFEYPVRMSPRASDAAILELSIPELLVAAEPMAVTRVEHEELADIELGNFDAVVYLAPRMHAELASPALEVELLTPGVQDVTLNLIDRPTIWAWTLRAPEVTGKQVMTLRLFREGDPVPLWIGSFRVDVVAERQLSSSLDTDEQTMAPEPQPATMTPVPTGLIPRVVEALTQDITTVVMGLLGLIGTIIAALVAAWVDRGGTGRGSPSTGHNPDSGQHPPAAPRTFWFRLSRRFTYRKRGKHKR